MGQVCKESGVRTVGSFADNGVIVKLARFADRTNLDMNESEDKLPPWVVAFDKRMAEYRNLHPDATSLPRKFLRPCYGDDHQLKKVVEKMKADGYIKVVYIKSPTNRVNKFGEHKYIPQLQRSHPKGKLLWSNPISQDTAPTMAPELIEPDQTMANHYRDLLKYSDATINNVMAYTGSNYYVARGVDKNFCGNYSESINVRMVEVCKTVTKVKSANATETQEEAKSNGDGVGCLNEDTTVENSQNGCKEITKKPTAKGSKKGGSVLWKDFLGHDLEEFGIELAPEDFEFKHKFFRTDLQKLRRAIILKHLARISVMEIALLGNVVSSVEKAIGLNNPMWDRKSKKKFLDILSSEGLINQLGVKYDRHGIEKEIHLIVLPGVDENHKLVHKLISDKATVRFIEKDEKMEFVAEQTRVAEALQEAPDLDIEDEVSPKVSMLLRENQETSNTEMLNGESQSNNISSLSENHSHAQKENAMSVLDAESYQQCSQFDLNMDGLNDSCMEANIPTPPKNPKHKNDEAAWGKLGWNEKEEENSGTTFGLFVPTMHMAKILHSILLYKVRGVSICLSPKFLRKLDSFMVSPCAYGDGWIHYSDVLDMLPMKVLAMFLEKTAMSTNFNALCNLFLYSYEVAGLIHPTLRSIIVSNEAIANRVWYLVKILCALGLVTLSRKTIGERRKAAFIYIHTKACFYDTSQNPDVLDLSSYPTTIPYPKLEFELRDLVSLEDYWEKLRDISVRTCLNEKIVIYNVFASRFLTRKWALHNGSGFNLEKYYISKPSAVPQCREPVFVDFGTAGTEERLFLQDPIHWYPVKEANATLRQIVRQLKSAQDVKDSCIKNASKQKLSTLAEKDYGVAVGRNTRCEHMSLVQLTKTISERCAVKKKHRENRILQRSLKRAAAANHTSAASKAEIAAKKLKLENAEKVKRRILDFNARQKQINQEIGEKKEHLRVIWSSEEDAVLVYGYIALSIMRAVLPFPAHNTYRYLIRDFIHELLPNTAKGKNEASIVRRFRYLMSHDYKSMLLYFGLKTHAEKFPIVAQAVNAFKDDMSSDELYNHFKILYNALVHCNRKVAMVSAHDTMFQIERKFTVEQFFSVSGTENFWDYSDPSQPWKNALHVSIQTLTLNYFFEKNTQPFTASTIVMGKLLDVPSIAELTEPVYNRLRSQILVENSRALKDFPKYRRFVANLNLQREINKDSPLFIVKIFMLWMTKQVFTKSLVTIYEEENFSDELVKRVLLERQSVMHEPEKERYAKFFVLCCLMESLPYFKMSLDLGKPLFDYPNLDPDLEMLSTKKSTDKYDSDSEDEEGLNEEQKIALISMQEKRSVPGSINDTRVKGEKKLKAERIELCFDHDKLKAREAQSFDKADKIRQYLSVTFQERDQKIMVNIPKISLKPASLNEDWESLNETMKEFYFDKEDGFFQKISVKTVYDLLLIRSPSDCELLPDMPFYVTSFSDMPNSESLSEVEIILLASIQNATHEGLLFEAILNEFGALSELDLLQLIRSLIEKGAILICGNTDLRFCAREFCPFFTSLKSEETVTAHRIPNSFVSIKFLPAAFINWDGSLCKTMFASVLFWLVETTTYLPGMGFIDFYDRISCIINQLQFMKLVKLAERLNLISIQIHLEETVSDGFFLDDELDEELPDKAPSDFRNVFLFPVAEGMIRTKLLCDKFNMKRQLFFIGPQRLVFYGTSLHLFKTRKIFDTFHGYLDLTFSA